MVVSRFIVLRVAYTVEVGLFRVIATTDVPCHLYLRYSTVIPKKHAVPVFLRGVAFRQELYQCFVAYHDNEQLEPGDTLIHTFDKTAWQICTTYYFYFLGTIRNLPSPSTSPIFKKHRTASPVTTDFYPDPHPEITSVDGRVWQLTGGPGPGGAWGWNSLRNAPGNGFADQAEPSSGPFIRRSNTDTWWDWLVRVILLFDTSAIPRTSTIVEATLTLKGEDKFDAIAIAPDTNIYTSTPDAPTGLQASDYTELGIIPLSDPISYADWSPDNDNIFTLNSAGRVAITPGGITKLGVRNANYDAQGVEPTWGGTWPFASGVSFWLAEKGGWRRPKLTITYLPPP